MIVFDNFYAYRDPAFELHFKIFCTLCIAKISADPSFVFFMHAVQTAKTAVHGLHGVHGSNDLLCTAEV